MIKDKVLIGVLLYCFKQIVVQIYVLLVVLLVLIMFISSLYHSTGNAQFKIRQQCVKCEGILLKKTFFFYKYFCLCCHRKPANYTNEQQDSFRQRVDQCAHIQNRFCGITQNRLHTLVRTKPAFTVQPDGESLELLQNGQRFKSSHYINSL